MKTLSKMKYLSILGSLLAAFILLFAAIIIRDNKCFTVSSYALSYDALPAAFDGFKIVQISDLHMKEYGKDNEKLLLAIDSLSPDIIVMTGDMLEPDSDAERYLFPLAEKLLKKYAVYYVSGNHEQRGDGDWLESLFEGLVEIGVHALDNEKAVIEKDGAFINIYGMNIGMQYYANKRQIKENPDDYFSSQKMIKTIGARENAVFSILLTHNPAFFDTYAEWEADLTLCGHTHGGMVRLPLIGGLISPDKSFFPEYDAGKFEKDGKTMIVSRGLSRGTKGFRFLNTPDIVFITLSSI